MNSSVEDTIFNGKYTLKCGDKLVDLSQPKVMGILNITPDSFYDFSRKNTELELLKSAEEMLRAGAFCLDLGAYSTRPGSSAISTEEEIKRLIPAIQAVLKHFPESIVSVDTFRSEVARRSLEEGALIVNDISGFQLDEKLLETISAAQASYILMHHNESVEKMHETLLGEHPLHELGLYFLAKIERLKAAGIHDIIIDPGFGFGKTLEQNFQILKHLDYFTFLDLPILVGVSRKSMIQKTLGVQASEALNGTTAVHTYALQKGAKILRTHDVKEAVEAIKILQSIG